MSSYYGRRFNDPKHHLDSEISSEGRKKTLKLRANSPQATEVEIDEDGIIYAKGFVDLNDDYEIILKHGKVYYAKDAGLGYHKEIDISSSDTTYYYSSQISESWSGMLAYFEMPIQRFDHTDFTNVGKYKKYKKSTKTLVSKWIGNGENIVWPEKSNEEYNGIHLADRISYKPFNYDICLKPEADITNISDIICIKTGEFNTVSAGLYSGKNSGIKQENIVWVSPHESLTMSGLTVKTGVSQSGYARLGGVSVTGMLSGQNSASYSGAQRPVDRTVFTGIKILTSKNYTLASGQMLSGGATYDHSSTYYSGYSGVGNEAVITGYKTSGVTSPAHLQNTLLYQNYSGRMKRPKRPITGYFPNKKPMYGPKATGYLKDNFATSYQWNGIIPSGTPFSIEIWSSDYRDYGMDNSIGIYPYTGVHGVSGGNWPYSEIEIAITGIGHGEHNLNWLSAEENAKSKAYDEVLRKHKALLIKNKIWNSGSKGVRYSKMKKGEIGLRETAGPGNDFRFNQSWTGVHGAEIVSGRSGAS
tara:strand:+ start:1161 stop:2747 length:1587 start_codon:yes stop_codon:yes gene_type:complete